MKKIKTAIKVAKELAGRMVNANRQHWVLVPVRAGNGPLKG